MTDIGLVHLCGVLSGTSRTLQVGGYFTILQVSMQLALVDGLGMGILMNTLPISASPCGLSLPEGALLQSSGEHFVSNFVWGYVLFAMMEIINKSYF